MVAHLDEVTSLACDPNGLYLLSGSELFADFDPMLLFSLSTMDSISNESLLFLPIS